MMTDYTLTAGQVQRGWQLLLSGRYGHITVDGFQTVGGRILFSGTNERGENETVTFHHDDPVVVRYFSDGA